MKVYDAWSFGYDDSGFVIEGYVNLDRDGVIGGADGPVPALNDFNGMRITDCRTGRMLALDGVFPSDMDVLTATEFLRAKVQGEKRFRLTDIEKAAEAVYGNKKYVRIIKLREIEETCACREYFPGLWK
ncbi:hypothetical protein [Marimonas arenosa]|nr:hypothetical protein [Marimonas arenosa]